MTGAHSRHTPGALKVRAVITANVASALSGAPAARLPSGTPASRSPTAGSTVIGISMITVPATAGVTTRCTCASRQESSSGTAAVMITSVASSAGPPSATAVMLTEMNAVEAPMSNTCPPPNRPKRNACSTVVAPDTATVANTAHDA